MAGKSLSELISSFDKDKAATFFKENYRALFGDQFDLGSLQKLITESYEDVTPASSFRRMKKTEGVTDPEFYKKFIESFGVPEEELLRHGHTVTKQRFIGRSHDDLLDVSRAFASGNGKFRNERTISGTLFDKATELDFNNADDFNIFENLYNFNESAYGPWRSPKSTPGNIQYLDSKRDFFNQYIEYYKSKNKLSETGAIKKLQQIEQKAKEMNLSGYDFGDLIEERKILNKEYKTDRQEGHRISREYKVKRQRLEEIEQEMKNFRMSSPEYQALEKEYNNIYSDIYSGSAYEKEVLQLNAPREGAPMFEGGAVPSVIADSEDFDQYAKYNQSNSQVVNTSTTKNTSNTNTTASSVPQSIADNLKPGDNILDDRGHHLVYSGMDPVNKEMGIAFDSYNFYDVTEGRMEIYRNKDAMNKYLTKTDNTISLDKAKEINQARSSFYNEFKRFNDLTYNPETTSIEEFNASQRRFFEQRVVPVRDEFFNLYDNLENKDLVKFDYNENKFFNLYDKQLKHYQKLDAEAAANQTIEQPAGPKQGDAFWDNKNKRQLVYDGPDSVHGNHNFYTREGTVVNSSMDDLSPYKGKARLDYDMLKNYNTELNRFEQLTSPYFNLKYDDPETFYTDLTKNINKIDEYEKIIGSKYKSFKGNKSYHKTRAYMSDEINKYYGSEIIGEDLFNKKKNKNKNKNNTSASTNSTDTSTKETVETTTQDPQPDFDPENPNTWSDDYIERIRQIDPDYADELEELRKKNIVNTEAARSQNRSQQQVNQDVPDSDQVINNVDVPSPDSPIPETTHNVDTRSQVDPNNPLTWTEDYMDEISEGDPTYYEYLKNQKLNAENFDMVDDLVNNADDIAEEAVESGAKGLGKLGVMDKVMSGVNLLGAVGDYKAARRKGHGVVSSAVRAGAEFAVGEALGLWYIPVQLVKHTPGAIIKGADMLYKENRRMNSAANNQIFGNAEFMDTQQLATMRQSGMEMAKMAQYNLQQTLMGNEATYLHR